MSRWASCLNFAFLSSSCSSSKRSSKLLSSDWYIQLLQLLPMIVKTVRALHIFIGQPPFYQLSYQTRKKHFFNIQDDKPENIPVVYPKQYPTNLVDGAPLVKRGRPVRFITPKDDIPQIQMMSNDDAVTRLNYNDDWKSPQNAYSLNVGLIGPVNSGKSQLMSKLGKKVSSVSPKRNTTDEVIHSFKSMEFEGDEGIKNVQLKYFDTPGLTHNKTGYLSKGWKVLGQIDFSLLIIDSSKKFDDLLQESIKRLEKHRRYEQFMKALVLNKIDLVDNKRKFHGLIAQIEKYGKFDKIFYTSAITGYGVSEIENYLMGMAKKRDWEYPKESFTDSTEHQVIEQIFKEALFHRTYSKLPYDTVFECEALSKKSDGTHFAQFRVMVESEILQRMIIGKKGQNVNWMRDYFKAAYAKQFGAEVEIHVRVVIKKKKYAPHMEQIESSYYAEEAAAQMKVLRESLQKQGKFIR